MTCVFLDQADAKDFVAPVTCGTFVINGTVYLVKAGLELRVFSNTQSEIRLLVTPQTTLTASAFVNRPVTATAVISRKIVHYRGEIDVSEIELRNPFGDDPRDITDGFKVIKTQECKGPTDRSY